MLSICRTFRFEFAHKLPFYKGKCNRRHGHSGKLLVQVTGDIQKDGTNQGMITDFGILKDIVNEAVIENLDHYDLNEIYENPTAELVVEHIVGVLEKVLKEHSLVLLRLRLYETEDNFVEWFEENDHVHPYKYISEPRYGY